MLVRSRFTASNVSFAFGYLPNDSDNLSHEYPLTKGIVLDVFLFSTLPYPTKIKMVEDA